MAAKNQTNLKRINQRTDVIGNLLFPDKKWVKEQTRILENGPAYIGLEVPPELNKSRKDIMKMEKSEMIEYFEKIRIFLLDSYEKDKIPISGAVVNLNKIVSDFRRLVNLNVHDPKVFYMEGDKKVLKGYVNYGLKINAWFPEMQDVCISGQYSIIDQLRDPEMFFRKCHRITVLNTLKIYNKPDGRDEVFPKFGDAFRVVSGAQPVTNIRPSVAKWMWLDTALNDPDDDFIAWDPSMGWAGRLIAFLSACSQMSKKNNIVYIGTDPNEQIFDRYAKIAGFWKERIDSTNRAQVHPLCIGSEDFCNSEPFQKYKGRGSIVYTSPPYFAKEEYSSDSQQSYKKFPGYEGWRDGFLRQTIQNAYDFLAPGKLFFWNIADVKIKGNKLPLESDSIKFAEEVGFEYVETIHQLMKNFPGRDLNDEMIKKQIAEGSNFIKTGHGKIRSWVKFEPVFVFQKK